MQVAVVGAGAIGTLYAARLAREHEVILVTRRPEQAEAIRASGIRITGLEETIVRVEATARVATLDAGALVLLTTKVYDNVSAIEPLVPALSDGNVIVCLQNGLGGEALVKDATGGRCPVLRGITNFGAIFVSPGVVNLKARGDTVVERGPASDALADAFSRCQLAGRVSPDIRREVWKKLVVNCVINPLTAITGMEVGWIADERLDRMKLRVIDECVAVARREGVVLEDDFLRLLNETYGPSRNLSSMLQDVASGRRTEIDFMNGAVADLGRRHGVPCPINEALAAIIRALTP
jgi:2-dehydropantoate 2-reductase